MGDPIAFEDTRDAYETGMLITLRFLPSIQVMQIISLCPSPYLSSVQSVIQ